MHSDNDKTNNSSSEHKLLNKDTIIFHKDTVNYQQAINKENIQTLIFEKKDNAEINLSQYTSLKTIFINCITNSSQYIIEHIDHNNDIQNSDSDEYLEATDRKYVIPQTKHIYASYRRISSDGLKEPGKYIYIVNDSIIKIIIITKIKNNYKIKPFGYRTIIILHTYSPVDVNIVSDSVFDNMLINI